MKLQLFVNEKCPPNPVPHMMLLQGNCWATGNKKGNKGHIYDILQTKVLTEYLHIHQQGKQENSLFQTQNTADLNKITDTSAIITNHMRSPDNTPNASLMTYQIYCYYQFSTGKLCSRQHPSNYHLGTGDYSEIFDMQD